MWRLLNFSYRYAGRIVLGIVLLTVFLSLQIPELNVKVSSEELISENSAVKEQYEQVRSEFGSDEVVVIYVEAEPLFQREKLLKLKELNTRLEKLPVVQRVESLFNTSSISSNGGMLNTSPLLSSIPRSEEALKQRKEIGTNNPLLVGNVLSKDGTVTALTLYLKSPEELTNEQPNDTASAPADAGAMPPAPAPVPPSPSDKVQQIPAPSSKWQRPAQLQTQQDNQSPSKLAGNQAGKTDYAQSVYRAIEKELQPYRPEFDELFQVGSPAIQVKMTEYILDDQKWLLPLSMFVLILIIGVMLQSLREAFIPLFNAMIATIWTLGCMAIFGIPINMLNYIVPALILVIGATEDVHLLVEYRNAHKRGQKGASAINIVGQNIGLTLALTGITTVLGFAATGITDIKIMRDFAAASAIGMFARFLITIFFLPAYLKLFHKPFEYSSSKPSKEQNTSKLTYMFTNWVMHKVIPHSRLAFGVFIVLALSALFMASDLKKGNDLLGFLKEDSDLVKELNTVSSKLSGTKVIYITLRGDPGDFKTSANLKRIERISNYLRDYEEFDTVRSLADYFSLVNREMHGGDPKYNKIPNNNNLIAQYLLFFHPTTLEPYVSDQFSKTNITIRCNINDSNRLNTLVSHIRNDLNSGMFGPVVFQITGKSIMVAESVEQLATGQSASIGFMIIALFIIIALLFISFKAASMTVLANLFAIVLLFGIMGIFGIPLNVGTAMVAAITIGIGIDDTLHLMVRYNKELKRRKDELPAIEASVREEFEPVVITSMGLIGGFAVLGTSSFVPVMQFGILSAVVITITVIADLILTPLLLSKTRLISIWDIISMKLKQTLMNTSPVFKGLNTLQAKELILASCVEEYAAGTSLIKEGDEGDSMYVILEGELEVSKAQNDKRILLSYLSTGEVFGEIALISKAKRSADVIAKTDTKLLVYDWESLVKLRRIAPYLSSRLLLNIANILGMRLVDAQSKLDDVPALASSAHTRKRRKL